MKGIIEMPNMKDREKNVFSVRKKNKKKNSVKTREEKLAKELEKALLQLHDQMYFRMDIYCGGLLLAKEIFMKDDASVDERSAAVCLLSKLTNINGMPDGVYDARWRDAFEGFHALHQFDCVYYRYNKLGEIAQNGYSVETTKEKVKRKNGFMKLKTVNKPNDKGRYVRNVTIYLTDIIQNTDVWDDFRKRVIFHEDSLGRITNVSFNEGSVVVPVHTGMSADFDGDCLSVFNGDRLTSDFPEQSVTEKNPEETVAENTQQPDDPMTILNSIVNRLNEISAIRGWSEWKPVLYGGSFYIIPFSSTGIGKMTWDEVFNDPEFPYFNMILDAIADLIPEGGSSEVFIPTYELVDDCLLGGIDGHIWIDWPPTEKCGFAFTSNGNKMHFNKNSKLGVFPFVKINFPDNT